MYDAVLAVRDEALNEGRPFPIADLRAEEYVLATVHRAANTDDPDRLAGILDGLAAIERPVVVPLHPRTEDALRGHGLYQHAAEQPDSSTRSAISISSTALERVEGRDRLWWRPERGVLPRRSVCHAPEETEWVETVEAGWNVLVGSDAERIAAALTDRTEPRRSRRSTAAVTPPHGRSRR